MADTEEIKRLLSLAALHSSKKSSGTYEKSFLSILWKWS